MPTIQLSREATVLGRAKTCRTLKRILFPKFVGVRKTKIMGKGVHYLFMQSCIHLSREYLLSTKFVPHAVLGTGV